MMLGSDGVFLTRISEGKEGDFLSSAGQRVEDSLFLILALQAVNV